MEGQKVASPLKTQRFSIHVPKYLVDWLTREAARQDRTRNNLINRILTAAYKEQKGR